MSSFSLMFKVFYHFQKKVKIKRIKTRTFQHNETLCVHVQMVICCKWQSSCVYVALLKRKSLCFFSKDAPISVSMQKSGLNKRKCGIVCLFYLSVFILTLSSPNERWTYRCLCPGLHQCSLAFRNCVFRWGEWGGGVAVGPICFLPVPLQGFHCGSMWPEVHW